jgi:NhaP-type Na+/H+ and K+/H+ antiporter
LLLILLPVFAGIPGSDQLFRISALIVLISILIHGSTPTLLARFCKKSKEEETPETEPAQPQPEPVMETRSLPVIESPQSVGTQSITLKEFEQLQNSGENVILLDVRTERSREPSESQAKGSVRIVPEGVVAQARAKKLPKDAWLIAYCA